MQPEVEIQHSAEHFTRLFFAKLYQYAPEQKKRARRNKQIKEIKMIE